MKKIRILHCGNSIQNYYLCCQDKVGGFTSKFNNVNQEWIYIAVRVGNKSVCGARGKLGNLTDYKPDFEDQDKFIQYYKLNEVEYCTPFDLGVLKEAHVYWGAKYLQGYKLLDDKACNICEDNFIKNMCETIDLSLIKYINSPLRNSEIISTKVQDEDRNFDITSFNYSEKGSNDKKHIEISSCFQTIRFKNETDNERGLEQILKNYFYDIFEFYQKENSLLISKNRLFNTKGIKSETNKNLIPGLIGIPDGLLVTFNTDNDKLPLMINLIEYECYGETRTRTSDKERYFDGVITAQLMRFANTFSISTASSIRENTIDDWVNKILNFVEEDEELSRVKNQWIQKLYPSIKDTGIDRLFEKELKKAFKFNLKIILIIDEIMADQKDRLKTMINNVKLEPYSSTVKDNFVEFGCYVVRLEQKIKLFNIEGDYSLSMQEY